MRKLYWRRFTGFFLYVHLENLLHAKFQVPGAIGSGLELCSSVSQSVCDNLRELCLEISCEPLQHKINKFLNQMLKGDLMLARFRAMTKNLTSPAELTQCTESINFGSVLSILAPHVPASDPPQDDKKGVLLGGRLASDEIPYTTDLRDGCKVVGILSKEPTHRSAFILTSADYCDRSNEQLKYNQEYLLALASSVANKKPLYLRYDPDPFPGLTGTMPLYLSEHPVSAARWRMLPVQKPNITRFEQEGKLVQVNTDLIINHCSTNINLGINVGRWVLGFYGKFATPLMKTCLDIHGRELPNNIWQIYVPSKV